MEGETRTSTGLSVRKDVSQEKEKESEGVNDSRQMSVGQMRRLGVVFVSSSLFLSSQISLSLTGSETPLSREAAGVEASLACVLCLLSLYRSA